MTFVVVWFDVVDEPGEEEAVVGFIDVVVPVSLGLSMSLFQYTEWKFR